MEENIHGWFFLKIIQWLDDHIIQTRRRMPPITKYKSAYDTSNFSNSRK
jgi:hypothetical protein